MQALRSAVESNESYAARICKMQSTGFIFPNLKQSTGCIICKNASVVPSSNFLDFIHCASRICLGQNSKDLVWRRQICPLKINIFTLNALISTNEVSMFKLAIEVCFENYFGLIHAIFLSLGSSKSVYTFFWDTRYAS